MRWIDLVYSYRRLRKTPGVILAVVLSIGLGIAANATIFSYVRVTTRFTIAGSLWKCRCHSW